MLFQKTFFIFKTELIIKYHKILFWKQKKIEKYIHFCLAQNIRVHMMYSINFFINVIINYDHLKKIVDLFLVKVELISDLLWYINI